MVLKFWQLVSLIRSVYTGSLEVLRSAICVSDFFFSVVQQPSSRLGRIFRGIEVTHTPGRISSNEWPARRRGRYLQNTQKRHKRRISLSL